MKFGPALHPGGVCIPTHSGYFSICFLLWLWLLGASKIEISKVNSQLPKFVSHRILARWGKRQESKMWEASICHEPWPQMIPTWNVRSTTFSRQGGSRTEKAPSQKQTKVRGAGKLRGTQSTECMCRRVIAMQGEMEAFISFSCNITFQAFLHLYI